tara:strand:- start:332 stop:544 length:213 start_codon:yes stop_codon:yes gene_type:complete
VIGCIVVEVDEQQAALRSSKHARVSGAVKSSIELDSCHSIAGGASHEPDKKEGAEGSSGSAYDRRTRYPE